MVRVSASFGIALVLMYWTAHMDFPYIENQNNFLLDYHIVYAGVLAFLIIKRAGHIFGLDGAITMLIVERHPALRPLVAERRASGPATWSPPTPEPPRSRPTVGTMAVAGDPTLLGRVGAWWSMA